MAEPNRIVILDTTALFVDRRLSRPEAQALLAASRTGHLRLVLPEIVVQEAIGHFFRELNSSLRELRSAERRLLNSGVAVTPADVPDAERTVRDYEDYIRQRVVAANGEIAPIPPVDHALLLRKAIQRCKPFAEKGAGYRDALIWQTVLLYTDGADVAFVTGNTSDFCEVGLDQLPVLHSDLKAELRANGVDSESVKIYKTIAEYIKDTAVDAVGSHSHFEIEFSPAGVFRDRLECLLRQQLKEYDVGKLCLEKDVDSAFRIAVTFDVLQNVIVESASAIVDGSGQYVVFLIATLGVVADFYSDVPSEIMVGGRPVMVDGQGIADGFLSISLSAVIDMAGSRLITVEILPEKATLQVPTPPIHPLVYFA